MRKDISVVILLPVYNAETYLKEAIDSILNQTYKNFRFLILNDGSTDASEKIILSYSDERITYIKNESNQGLIFTLNRGLELVKQEDYLIRMDNDDIALPERIERQLEFMESHPDVWISGTQIQCFGESQVVSDFPLTHQQIKTSLLFSSTLSHPTVIMRIQKLKEHQLRYDDHFLNIEDYELWTRVMHLGELANLPVPLLKYRIEGQNVSIQNWRSRTERHKLVYKKLLTELEIPVDDHHLTLHAELSGTALPIRNIGQVISYSSYLVKQNEKKMIYDVKALTYAVGELKKKLFYRIVDQGLLQTIRYFYAAQTFSIKQVRYLIGHYKSKR